MPKESRAEFLRKWVGKTICLHGGPSKCADDFILGGGLMMMVNSHAALEFGGIIATEYGLTVTEYVKVLEDHFPESGPKYPPDP